MRVFTTNKRLRDRLDNYSNLLWAADAKLKDLTAENDKLKDENDKLKTKNSTLQSASAKKINNLHKVIKQKQEKIENQRDNLSVLLDFYLNSENALSVKRKIAGLRHRIEYLESELGLKARSAKCCRLDVDLIDGLIDGQNDRIDDMQEEIIHLRIVTANQAETIVAKDAEIAKLNGWVDELIRIGEMTISGYGTSPWNELLSRIRKEREE